jgi:hypothetical protein
VSKSVVHWLFDPRLYHRVVELGNSSRDPGAMSFTSTVNKSHLIFRFKWVPSQTLAASQMKPTIS